MAGSRLPALRLFLWLTALLIVGLVAQQLVVTHQARVRGLHGGFPVPVAEADVPILGVNVALGQYDGRELKAALDQIEAAGFVWVRDVFYRRLIESEPGRFDWTVTDRIVTAVARRPGLRLVAVLDGDDRSHVPPADPDDFASFAHAFAARYSAQVDYYQVWDEPNLADHWGGGPVNPLAYAALLARTARAIRDADPGARILLAGLAPTVETGPQNLSDVRYLDQLYRAGAAPYFDIVSGKPYGFDTGSDDRRAPEDGTVLNFSRLLLLREVMVRHGDADKAIWASHYGWNALPPGWTGGPSLWGQADEATQAAHTVAALERARTEWPWVGVLFLEHFQPALPPDDPHWGFALVGQDGAPRPVYRAVAAWATALPDAAPVGGYEALNRWATYEGGWLTGPLGADVGADGDRASFRFEGTSVALTVRRGPYRSFLYVNVDGVPADGLPQDEEGRAYVVLYDGAPSVATVPLATGLSPGLHVVEVVAEGGHGQWVLVDWRVGPEPVRDGYGWNIAGLVVVGFVLTALLVRDARRMDWGALVRAFLAWPEWVQLGLAVGLTGLFWITAGASWGQSWGSPWFVISLLALLALAALLALRIDLGLALVAFVAPFYLHPDAMLYRALSLPEVLVTLCGVGVLIRRSGGKRGIGRQGDKGQEVGGSGRETRGRGGKGTERRGGLTFVDWSVLLLVAAAVVASLAAVDRLAALFELRTVFLFPALYYVLLRFVRLDARDRWQVVDGWVLGGIGVAVIGLVQYALGRNVVVAEGGASRLQSVYHSPNNVGLYLGRVWPLLVAVALWGVRERQQVLYGLALVPVTLALGLCFSRGALLLALPAAVLAMGWQARGRYRWLALALVAAGALALIPLLRLPRFASLLDLQQGSTFFRLELWRSSLALLRDHPWFGVGPGNFLAAYRTRYVLPSAWQEFNLEHPHSVYLDHWARLGLLGLVAGLVVQVAFWREVWRKARCFQIDPSAHPSPLALGLAGSMATLLAHGLVDNTLFFPDLAVMFCLTLALIQ